MTRLLFIAEIKSEGFEPEMTLDGEAQEVSANLLLDVLARGKVVWGSVSKIPDSARETMQ